MDDVLNEGKVAALFAVAIDGGRFSGQHLERKDGQNSGILRGWILIRAEDIEVAERDGLQSVDAGEGLHVKLAGQLGDCVRRDRAGVHVFGFRQRGSVAVARTRSLHKRRGGLSHPWRRPTTGPFPRRRRGSMPLDLQWSAEPTGWPPR